MDLMSKIKTFFRLIKFEHSIFALPFAYLGLFLAEDGLPRFSVFFWVTVAMISIRTAGMCLNRIIDRRIDAKNPRTKDRRVALQFLSLKVIWFVTVLALVIFIGSAFQLNSLCFYLSPIVIALVWVYPHFKKFTWCSHFILGMILGIAPYAGWLASTGRFGWLPFPLMISVASWVSGFDMFYALQDVEFDRREHLKSFPAVFGVNQTLKMVRLLHAITVLSLAYFGLAAAMGFWYWTGWLVIVGLILKEHNLVARFGLSKINEAFFNMNAWVSAVIFIAVALQLTLSQS